MTTKFLKPAKDTLKVRDPATGEYLPTEGKEVEVTSYWRRRIKDGDVVEASKPRKSRTSSK